MGGKELSDLGVFMTSLGSSVLLVGGTYLKYGSKILENFYRKTSEEYKKPDDTQPLESLLA